MTNLTGTGSTAQAAAVNGAVNGAQGDRAQRRLAVCFAAVLAAGAITLLVLTRRLIPGIPEDSAYYQSSAFFPRLALAIIAVCAILHARDVLRGASLSGDDIDDPAGNWRLVLLSMTAYALYLLAAPLAGYTLSTLAFAVVVGVLAGLQWRLSLVVAAGVTAALYLIFVVGLGVWFPVASLLNPS